ncbi:MAG: hypothetical protein ACE15B_12845 [Bryobacteraceae bacterium]
MKLESEILLIMGLVAGAFLGLLWFLNLLIRINSIRDRSRGDPRCLSCGIRDVRLSEPRGVRDALYGLFSCVPYRCRSCGARFYRHQAARPAASAS